MEIPVAAVTKYLGMHLDHKLNWRDIIVTKRKQIELKVKKLSWLLGRKSQLSIANSIPYHQFGFRHEHFTIQQVYRISHTIHEALKKKKKLHQCFS